MRILYITNGITGAGGLERVLSVKASYLAGNFGHEVCIVSLNEAGKTKFYTFSNKIKFVTIPAKGNPLAFCKNYISGLKKAISEFRPDVISVCDDGLKGFFVPMLLGKPCPMVYERHASINLNLKRGKAGAFSAIRNKIMYKLMQAGAKSFDKFVVLTSGNTKEWPSKNVVIIPNPLSFYPEAVSALDQKKVIAVGNHSYNKGYDLLLEAWKIVTEKHPDWQLDIYGKKDAASTYSKLAEILGVKDSVKFHDPVTDIAAKYVQSSIMVLPSRSEGFGMVLIEAMACGLPCVSFDCPNGPADIISNNEDGFLIENGNITAFAEKIILLMENAGLRKSMAAKGRENVTRFLPENIVGKWDSLFKALIRP